MLGDAWTVMWKEGKELFRVRGSLRGGTLGIVFFLSVFGIFLPLRMGTGWVQSPYVLFLWIWIPLFLVSSVVADAFAGERERNTLETLLASRLSDRAILVGKMAAAVAYGWGLTMASLVVGVFTLNLSHPSRRFLFYSPILFLGIFLLSFLGAGLTATAGVLISLKASTVRQAQQTLSIAIMLLLFVPIFGIQALPDAWTGMIFIYLGGMDLSAVILLGTLLLLLLDALFFWAAVRKFRRNRLILD